MITAHAPSGYILARQLIARWQPLPIPARAAILIAMIGALAPDFDMIYFYLVDAAQTHHHRYFTHWPIVWLSLMGISALSFRLARPAWKAWAFAALLFCSAAFMHIILDTLVGDIWWLAPFYDKPYALFTVPARFSPWWLNFFLHWSFVAELLIWAWAIRLYRRP